MAKLIYFTPMSLDGFIADETGNLDWAPPDAMTSAMGPRLKESESERLELVELVARSESSRE